VVWLDAGNFFGDPGPVGEMQNDTLLEGMGRIGYVAANVGERELAHGVERFLAYSRRAKFQFVSANLVLEPSGEPFVKPYLVHAVEVKDREGGRARSVRLGILGLTRATGNFLRSTPDGRNIVIQPPVEAARRWAPELRRKADVTIALVSMRYEDALEVAQAAEDSGAPFDFILGGMGDFVSRDEASLLGSTKVVYAGDQGKRLGETRVFLDGKKRVKNSIFNAVWLTRDFPGDPELEAIVQTQLANINDWHRTHQVMGSPVAAVTIGAAYTGGERCGACHAEADRLWRSSAHARALDTLASHGQAFNPECLKCHTTAYGKPGGFVSLQSTPGLAQVQCESCHGASGTHPEAKVAGFGKAGMMSCLVCHNRENSPEFNFAIYWERIRH
jgi:2',3'-cyclic-nucleotide 2'-phosphodiesterase (5'-nucleotidase family)